MFRISENKTKEERLCEKYSRLMERSYKLALTDKSKSDQLNQRARNILEELQKMDSQRIDS
ncbi:Lacal_2735 family protein [Gramella sp. GC03-9]|uniref:Lacal_2735 family protein n=1 Tax=Christiangramia oceanisediminis TaxID=2920386 RepID=A0A9X2I816_9FLAO|nr:Lacal_2735 family protein [Gramella oceanisediminis]MCP9198383.1 Lacal_2735 family protein [Gramella oceanisediminis]